MGWEKTKDGQTKTWYQSIKSFIIGLAHLDRCRSSSRGSLFLTSQVYPFFLNRTRQCLTFLATTNTSIIIRTPLGFILSTLSHRDDIVRNLKPLLICAKSYVVYDRVKMNCFKADDR